MAKYPTDTGLQLDDSNPEDRKILERQRGAAREAGKSGADRAATTRGRADLGSAFDEGAREGAAPSAGQSAVSTAASARSGTGGKGRGTRSAGVGSLPTPTLRAPRSASARDAGGFALGLLIHALVVSYIRYGKAGPKGWMAAKFLNKPIQGDDLEKQNRKDANNGVDPAPSGRGPNGEIPSEGHMDPNKPII